MDIILNKIKEYWVGIAVVIFLAVILLQPKAAETKKLIIVENDKHSIQYITADDIRITGDWDYGDEFVYNRSSRNIYLEPVVYSSSGYEDSSYRTLTIGVGVVKPIKNKINYILTNPPETISVSRSASKIVRWHLHR